VGRGFSVFAAACMTSPQIINKAIEQTRKEKPRIEEILKQKAFPEKAKNL